MENNTSNLPFCYVKLDVLVVNNEGNYVRVPEIIRLTSDIIGLYVHDVYHDRCVITIVAEGENTDDYDFTACFDDLEVTFEKLYNAISALSNKVDSAPSTND